MNAHGFNPKKYSSDELNRALQEIKDAFDGVAAAINPRSTFVSFVANGSNGRGNIQLPLIRDSTNMIPLRRASVGARLVAAVNLTNSTDLQRSFEQTISTADQIRQIDGVNLSAKSILFII